MNRFISLTSIVFIMFLCSSNISAAADESRLISSGEKLLEEWEKMITRGYYPLTQGGEYKAWRVSKCSFVKGSGSYDINKTESIVTPYVLTLKFKVLFLGWNTLSPNANGVYSDYFKRTVGFKTQAEALKNIEESDFLDRDLQTHQFEKVKAMPREIMCNYVLKKNNWILKSGNDFFDIIFSEKMEYVENAKYFNNLTSFPIK
jgi:hypothetical protein